ncbi:FAD-dependent oxidoreductase [Streptomyces sp. ISL-22]|uniref:FAD-dependent oxidoreductase n=1 Tax=unclassified Streptomyces TaxID=2593676 RepID=UPI001BEBC61F|nr:MULTISPECIES: FAD-dependent oxidoreductase [unclassified Streptomyces]MBT2420337.1 FAD-dependent oxidoreductase [Streptomyces sp. ISL-24]MBT2433049.1 FAD-dependent oxidoreductase [Streptomyces sp. ISL-22]
MTKPLRVCVVGAGMAGLGAAWALDRHPEKFTVHVFEAKGRLGGNGCTVDLPMEDGSHLPVDMAVTSFIPAVYHNFAALLRWCGIEAVPTRFSYAVEYQGSEYAHDTDSTLKRRYRRDLDAFLRMLRVLRAWNTLSKRPSRAATAANPFQYVSVRRVLDWWGISTGFRYAILKPISVNFVLATDIFEMPAALFCRYFDFFDIEASTPMMTWQGGTREIYRKMTAGFQDRVHLDRPVTAVLRDEHGVTIRDAAGCEERFDTVVMACNANQSLLALDRPSAWERALLGRVRYNSELHNHAVVHGDTSVLPADAADEMLATRSNFIRQYGTRPDNYEITYLMHNQQPWIREAGRHCLVTYNPERPVDPDTVVAREWFQHVAYDVRHMNALMPLFPRLQGRRRTWYCGAHTLVNSQELALVSGLSVARQLGADFPFPDDQEARTWFNFYGRLVQGRAFRRV